MEEDTTKDVAEEKKLSDFKYLSPARGEHESLKSQPLYQIEANLRELLEELALNEGEMTDEQVKLHDELLKSFNTKGENYGYVINDIKGDIAKLDGEIDRLTKRRLSYSNAIKRIEYVLIPAIQRWGTKKITPTGIVKYILKFPTITYEVATKETFEITNLDDIPDEFKKYKIQIDNTTFNKLKELDIKFEDKGTDCLKNVVEEHYDKLNNRKLELESILHIPEDKQLDIFTEENAHNEYYKEYTTLLNTIEELEGGISVKNVTSIKTK